MPYFLHRVVWLYILRIIERVTYVGELDHHAASVHLIQQSPLRFNRKLFYYQLN